MWRVPREELEIIVTACLSYAQVLRALGGTTSPHEYRTLKKRLAEEGLSTAHFRPYEVRKCGIEPRPLSDVLVEDSTYSRGALKRRLIKAGLLDNQCAECKLAAVWRGRPLTLVIDHINGVGDDHRLENLRLLCPNCDSQTDTFAGRNSEAARAKRVEPKIRKARPSKIDWPSTALLIQMINETSYSAVGKELGVSDNAVRKRIRTH